MSFKNYTVLTKDNIDHYLKLVAKEYRKLAGKHTPAEIIIVGGASVVINYGFRGMTNDIDALMQAASSMKTAINNVGDEWRLPNGWLNSDFKYTNSYSDKLYQHSSYYKTFSNIVTVRTVSGEYLIAMKLRSGRPYKNDMSDIVGILSEHEERNTPISLEMIKSAYEELYGSWDSLSEKSQKFIQGITSKKDYIQSYSEIRDDEKNNMKGLQQFEERYPGILNKNNLNDIIAHLHDEDREPQISPLNAGITKAKKCEMDY